MAAHQVPCGKGAVHGAGRAGRGSVACVSPALWGQGASLTCSAGMLQDIAWRAHVVGRTQRAVHRTPSGSPPQAAEALTDQQLAHARRHKAQLDLLVHDDDGALLGWFGLLASNCARGGARGAEQQRSVAARAALHPGPSTPCLVPL